MVEAKEIRSEAVSEESIWEISSPSLWAAEDSVVVFLNNKRRRVKTVPNPEGQT